MSVEVGQPVAAAATTQFKLFPYDEEEPAIWFRLKGPVRRTGIKSEKLKYAKAFANLSKQVLQDILDTVVACNESDQLFDVGK
jgi:hypothetical protein